MGVQTHIEQFLVHLTNERRLSAHTIAAYRRDLTALDDYRRSQSLEGWDQVGPFEVRRFAAEAHRKGLSPRSIARRLSATRSFFTYLLRENVLHNNPAVDVQAPKAPRRLPNTLDADQMDTLYQKRWAVEEFHASIKGNTSLAASPTKTKRSQKNHVFASIYAFVKLELLSVEVNLNHFALRSKLYIKALQASFAELNRLKLQAVLA